MRLWILWISLWIELEFSKKNSVKLLTPQETVLRYVHAKQIPRLNEKLGSQMVDTIGRLLKSSKMGKWIIPKKINKTIDKLEYSSYDAYKLIISKNIDWRK